MFQEKKRSRLGIFLTVFSFVLSGGLIVFILLSGYITGKAPEPQAQLQQQNVMTGTAGARQIAAEVPKIAESVAESVAKSATPGVVGISVLKVDSSSIFDRNAAEKWGVGSGLIVSSNGYILTNNHVAGGYNKRLIVSLSDGRNVDGIVKWADPVLDLAVVKINLENLPVIPLGDSSKVNVGETAIAIGNPLGLQFQRTVTSGIISALNRTIKIDAEDGGSNYMEDLIQTDASINPGNSGGPLLNSKGEAIGINTIKVTSAEGMGFAIPINVTKPIIDKFVKTNDFVETYMGIFAYDKEIIPYLDSSVKVDNGIYVSDIDENGPAYKSGLRKGCIITQVDNLKVETMLQLRTYLYTKNPGDVVNVTHYAHEQDKYVTVPVKLIAKEKDGLVTR